MIQKRGQSNPKYIFFSKKLKKTTDFSDFGT